VGRGNHIYRLQPNTVSMQNSMRKVQKTHTLDWWLMKQPRAHHFHCNRAHQGLRIHQCKQLATWLMAFGIVIQAHKKTIKTNMAEHGSIKKIIKIEHGQERLHQLPLTCELPSLSSESICYELDELHHHILRDIVLVHPAQNDASTVRIAVAAATLMSRLRPGIPFAVSWMRR